MGEQDVSAQINALARQLRATRTLAVGLAAAVVGLIAWTIYVHVHKPDTITLTSDKSTLELTPYGISVTQRKEKGAIELKLGAGMVMVTGPGGVAGALLLIDGKTTPFPVLDLRSAESTMTASVTDAQTELRLYAKKRHVGIRTDETGSSIDGDGTYRFALGSGQLKPTETPPPK